MTLNWELRILPSIRQPDRVAGKASDVSAADLRYQTDEEKYDIL